MSMRNVAQSVSGERKWRLVAAYREGEGNAKAGENSGYL